MTTGEGTVKGTRVERFVDAHHHLWDLATHAYPWLHAGDAPAGLRRDYLVADYRADVGDLPLAGSVHVEAGHDPERPVAETAWLDRQSHEWGVPTGYVAYARLQAADLEEVLDRHLAFARVRGIRQINGTPGDPVTEFAAFLDDPAWHRGLRTLARRGLSFDLQVAAPQLADAANLIADEPDLMFVLDHGGFCRRYTDDIWNLWRDGIRRVARHPNVAVKASGFSLIDPTFDEHRFAAFLDYLLDTLGADRVMFGSNFPVESLSTTYRELFDRYDTALSGLGDAERDAFFFRTADRAYRLGLE